MDPCSSSNHSESRVTHIDLVLTCDMSSKILYGLATYTYESTSDKIIFDTNHIEILDCSLAYVLECEHPAFGKPMKIALQSPQGQFSIQYKTTEHSSGIQFLSPGQTSGKQFPFCYTQCQAILCRSILPVQDTPSVKFTIDYHIIVPQNLQAVAAAIPTTVGPSIPGFKQFNFSQKIRIPSYLVAFAVGDIRSARIGPNSTLYAEPEILAAAAKEFEDIQTVLSTAESIMSPYLWGNLDLLVLPPSFPYGGMENPNLIFVTPSLIVGDKSQISVIMHEIAHSWTGNTVTNSTWEHFWLNEGFTVYFERKIVRKVFGEGFAQLNQANGNTTLQKTVALFGNEHNYTRLNLDNEGVDPDDAFSSIPYEKGCTFLLYLESLVGEENFLQFLRDYIKEFGGKNTDSQAFKEFFLLRFAVEVDWQVWLRGTGMPPWMPSVVNTMLDDVHSYYNRIESINPSPEDIQSWNSEQIEALLNLFLANPQEFHVVVCEKLGVPQNKNYEIRALWLTLMIKLRCEKYYHDVSQFLGSIGRMKYIRPIFRALHEAGLREFSEQMFARYKTFYHLILVTLLTKEFNFQR